MAGVARLQANYVLTTDGFRHKWTSPPPVDQAEYFPAKKPCSVGVRNCDGAQHLLSQVQFVREAV